MESISPVTATQAAPAKPAASGEAHLWENGDFSFGDILDAINPLQHLPVIGTIYRAITGDKIGTAPRLVGDLLFGGPLGFMAGVLSVGIKDQTGKDPGEQVLALLQGTQSDPAPSGPVLAAAPATLEPRLASEVAARLDEPAATVPPPSAARETPVPATMAPHAARLGVDVKPDHPPMPLIRSGGSVSAVPQTAVVPLQTATVVPRPPTFSAPTGPADVPRQMLDALDKYARMQNARGATVDLSN